MAASSRGGISGYLFMAAGVLLVAIATAVWYAAHADYEVYALLKVSNRVPAVIGDAGPASSEHFAIFKRTQAQLMLSPLVLNAVLRDPAINKLAVFAGHQDDPVSWLKDQLTVDYPDDAEIMRVAMRGPHPQDLARVVDKVVSVYLGEIVEGERQQRLITEEKLRRAHEQQTTEYEKQLAALRNLETIHGTSGSEQAMLKKRLADEELNRLTAQRARIAEEIRQVDVEIELAKDRVKSARQEVRTTNIALAEPPASELERKKAILSGQLAQTEKLIDSQVEAVASLDSFSAQVANAQEDLAALRSIKDRVGQQLDKAMIERLAPDRILLVDKATVVDNRSGLASRQWIAGGIGVLGLVLSGIGARLIARRRS